MTRRSKPAAYAWLSASLALLVVAGATLSYLGWCLSVPRLTDWEGNGISIKPNTTIALFAGGAALLLLALRHYLPCRRTAAVLGGAVALIGVATLFQHATGLNLGIDTLLFDEPPGARATSSPGRMGVPASLSLVLLGSALVLACARQPARRWATLPAVLAMCIATFSLIAYLFGADPLYTRPPLTGVALQTACMLFALATGLICALPEQDPLRLLREDSGAGMLARRFLPLVFLMPPLLGSLRGQGEALGWYDTATGRALLVASLMLLLGFALWRAILAVRAREISLATANEARSAAQQRLHESEASAAAAMAQELAAAQQLQQISTQLVQADDSEAVYEQVLDAALTLMHSQFASIQKVCATSGELELLGSRGFTPEAIRFWQHVKVETATSCGQALLAGERVIVADIASCTQMAGSDDQQMYLQTGIRAVQSTPLRARDGRMLGMLSTHWSVPHQPEERELRLLDILARLTADLMERRQAEEALWEADRRKDQFLATLSHELRNPLAPIKNSLELMKLAAGDPVVVEQGRATIERQVAHLSRLVNDLLDVSRISRDKIQLQRERVDLASVVGHALETCRPIADRLGHTIDIHLPPEPIYLLADRVRLAQVLGNVLHNACKYTDRGGRVSLSIAREGSSAVVRVQDSGVGIAPEMLPHVFDLFTQADAAAERSEGGLGIGLSLVKQLIEMHNGEVTAHSDGLGRGSVFEIRLPALDEVREAPAVVSPAPSPPPPPHFGPRAAGRRVLVVDDNRDAATSLAMLLKKIGSQTRTVHDGAAAVQCAAEFAPEVILLDIGLPKLNGYDACRAIRQQPGGKDMLLIALTGWGQEEDRRKSREAGFDGHLVKPVDFAELTELLAELKPALTDAELAT